MQKEEFNQYLLKIIAKNIDNKTIEQFGLLKDYVWHAFSNKLLICLSNDFARKKFDNTSKNLVDVFLYKCEYKNGFPDYYIEKVNKKYNKNLNSKIVDRFEAIEVYVLDKKKKWCYIKTHEENFGPYFYEL